MSSLFKFQRQLVKVNTTFNAFLLPSTPELSPEKKPLSMVRHLVLEDDTKEYWGFYLLKGTSVTVSTCVRYFNDISHIHIYTIFYGIIKIKFYWGIKLLQEKHVTKAIIMTMLLNTVNKNKYSIRNGYQLNNENSNITRHLIILFYVFVMFILEVKLAVVKVVNNAETYCFCQTFNKISHFSYM